MGIEGDPPKIIISSFIAQIGESLNKRAFNAARLDLPHQFGPVSIEPGDASDVVLNEEPPSGPR